jgi:hypothetical protein
VFLSQNANFNSSIKNIQIMKYFLFFYSLILSVNSYGQDLRNKSDTIPLSINEQNTIFIKAIFNDKDTLILNFDSGTTDLILTENTIKTKLSIAPNLYTTLYNLKIGKTTYQTKLYDAVLTGHGTDGRFGWNFFKGKVVELNYDKGLMIIHPVLPNSILKDKKYAKLNIEFWKDLFFVNGSISQSGVTNTDLFLFDIGYQRTVLLDDNLLLQNKFPTEKMDTIKRVIMKGAKGNEIPVITVNLKIFKLGKYKLKNVPVQLLTLNKPLKNKNTHILGNEVLKRFNIILDFQSNTVFLKPNHFFDENYIDQKKSGI